MKIYNKYILCCIGSLSFIMSSFANVTIPSFFSDYMVLQQQDNVKIWGWSNPHEPITITTSWSNDTITTKGTNYAKWEAVLKTPKAGGPYTITIKGYNEIKLNNVLIGEVWVCSGQSNMEWTASAGIDDAETAIASANFPNIRLFTVSKHSSETPQDNLDGQWQTCSPETMQYFSAVAYFFGKKLHQELDIPIGLINSSWGGSYAETWMPESVFKTNDELKKASEKINPVEWAPYEPGRIYNAMIHPLTKLNVSGVIWYQGENNTANSKSYHLIFSELIKSWRQAFNKEIPFYFAQIAPYSYHKSSGVEVRDAQRRTLELPNTAMVVTSDIGDLKDIHPRNKKDVGLRFAQLALKKHYNTIDAVVESPLYASAEVKNNKLLVTFHHADGLYATSKTSQFEVAGADEVFHSAKFKIKGNQIEVFSKQVKEPMYVRYAWGNTIEANIFNKVGLPMSSFTTQLIK
ncbi:sialate O-acetylesterase [Gaetbulibacter jejuensis]